MCLLVTQSTTSPVLSNDWLADFYSYNSDGIGVMHSHDGELIIQKILPKSAQDFIAFYHDNIKGKNCAFHLRMKTHGHIDLENCHPYEVLNKADHGIDLWLMHNGILSTGNQADISKSDTWHYIRDYLRPMLADNPEFYLHPSFSEIVEKHIGSSNKFVLMDNHGRSVTINQGAGVYWAGLWLSNTYAWSATGSESDKPVTSPKQAKKQAKEKPVKYSYKSSKYSSNYWDSRSDYFDGEDWSTKDRECLYFADDFEIALNELEIMGLFRASDISLLQAKRFVSEFDEGAFFDLVYSCVDGDLDEDSFYKCILNYDYARECFPFLNRITDLAYNQ
jgi:hypothetical protein